MVAITAANAQQDHVTKLVPGGVPALARLTDDELLANTRRLVGKSNQLLAVLLVHLAEVEVRGVHRTRRCASLYTYCIYELRFSEDAAARRSAAARFVKEFPALFEAVAAGELHLTGLLMIGPHLTPENQADVLGRAKFRTKKELAKLVRDLNPLPGVPDLIEPLGPRPAPFRKPTWAVVAASLCPEVRELPIGERPSEWANDGVDHEGASNEGDVEAGGGDELPVGPIPRDLPPVTGPQHYQLQFGTTEQHVKLVERARALLSRAQPGVTLGELHLEAMQLLVASLEKRRFAITDAPKKKKTSAKLPANGANPQTTSESPRQRGAGADNRTDGDEPPRQRGAGADNRTDGDEPPRQRGAGADNRTDGDESPRQRGDAEPRQCGADPSCSESPRRDDYEGADCSSLFEPAGRRSRYIPAAQKREVYRRDEGRCSYVDARGERCGETHHLELHHLKSFARNGSHNAANLALRCTAHNALAAEEDFGKAHITQRLDATRHETLSQQARTNRQPT